MPSRQSRTVSTPSMPDRTIAAPATLGTTWDRKLDTLVTSPSTRWINSPGVCLRWNSWSSPRTWRVMSRRRPLVIRHAAIVADRTTTTLSTWVTIATTRNRTPRRTTTAAVVPSVASSTMRRTISGPASAPADAAAMNAPSSAHLRASGRISAVRARRRDVVVCATHVVSPLPRRTARWVSGLPGLPGLLGDQRRADDAGFVLQRRNDDLRVDVDVLQPLVSLATDPTADDEEVG